MVDSYLWSAVVTVVSTSGHLEKIDQLHPRFKISVLIEKIAKVYDTRPAFIKLCSAAGVMSEDLYATLAASGIREGSQLTMVIVQPTAKASLHVLHWCDSLGVVEESGSLVFKVLSKSDSVKMFELCAHEENRTFQLIDLPDFESTHFVIAKSGGRYYLMIIANEHYIIWNEESKGFSEVMRTDALDALEVME